MATQRQRILEFCSTAGPVALTVEVARYYNEFPLQLAHDFPDEPSERLWREIGRILDAAPEEGGQHAVGHDGQVEAGGRALLDELEHLHRVSQLPADARRRWSDRESRRLLRARQLGLPEAPAVPRQVRTRFGASACGSSEAPGHIPGPG